jgi:hypothetical protein
MVQRVGLAYSKDPCHMARCACATSSGSLGHTFHPASDHWPLQRDGKAAFLVARYIPKSSATPSSLRGFRRVGGSAEEDSLPVRASFCFTRAHMFIQGAAAMLCVHNRGLLFCCLGANTVSMCSLELWRLFGRWWQSSECHKTFEWYTE